MLKPERPTDLALLAGISISYASEILGGTRKPSRPLAIHIFQKTGWRHDSITDLTDEQIDLLSQIEPYPSSEAAA
ncbi:MAG: hypothetical protein A3E01_09355 [Gammaproteobacteria bacterium RIFCSPHIGHO2_12_FULL_63_22]|nr:MAG: hypothetical protein A3E01_09355 [Gammaproteobacteria bacterium RIFCSPHIGHO2_12_FULL_63_22]